VLVVRAGGFLAEVSDGSVMSTILSKFLNRILQSYQVKQTLLDHTVHSPRLAAKFYPYRPELKSYVIRATPQEQRDDRGLPIPPVEIRYHSGSTDEYLSLGKKLVDNVARILQASNFALRPDSRVLDFGSADGVMVRWWHDLAKTGEVWGVDINGAHILWCQQNLSPPFKFVLTTSFPHLPFEDCYFDVIYAGSVFTHIADLDDAWLLELRRIVRPGGRLYLTVHDSNTIDYIMNRHRDEPGSLLQMLRAFDEESHFTSFNFSFFTINRTPGEGREGQAQVFYDTDYLRNHWGNYLRVVSITPAAYGYQTAILLEK
jgi:ubiquinone/menaquinone biosynthesis C-methylase UbiE